jgi:hypothetical protein
MKTRGRQTGFSLIEVNMAVFVMAVGILSMIVLYPLGLRESTQSAADLHQAMRADYILNQAVAAASLPDFPWSQWKNVPDMGDWKPESTARLKGVPQFMEDRMKLPSDSRFWIGCCRVRGASDLVMGIMVQSSELKEITDSQHLEELIQNNPIYYAEVRFQGEL